MESNVKPNLPYHIYRFSNLLYKWKIPFLPMLCKGVLRFVFGAVICPETQIGKNVHFGYNALGIVIHRRAIVGNYVHFYPHVLIGGKGGSDVPVIGDHVVLGAGAKILGKVRIGNYAKIGANAVVLQDVPDHATAVGIPAVIKLSQGLSQTAVYEE